MGESEKLADTLVRPSFRSLSLVTNAQLPATLSPRARRVATSYGSAAAAAASKEAELSGKLKQITI